MPNHAPIIGVVEQGALRVLAPPEATGATARLTTLSMQAAQPVESGALDLRGREDQVLLVSGMLRGDWVYEARLLDQGGPLVAVLARRLFGAPAPASAPEDAAAPLAAAAVEVAPVAPAPAEAAPAAAAPAESPEELLLRAHEALRREQAGLNVVGRPHTPEERSRLAALQKALRSLQQALKSLGVVEP